MAVLFFNEDVDLPSLIKLPVKQWVEHCIVSRNFAFGDINFIFVSDEYLLKINQEYLHHDYYTDVITFDYGEENLLAGDIFISVDRVKDNAGELNESFEQELKRVIIHGVLHLMGQNDKTSEEASEMRQKEDACLSEYSE
jgi:rRNA maturation RNase YbeY